ncbi:MAG: response regulator, partial [Nitrospirae bacterium]|nr:response regulator [Nitrospirota bacterium]
EAMSKNTYNLIFMDCQMPEMDGFEVTRRIRKIEKTSSEKRHVPIIALTANAMQGDQERCKGAGMDDYLSKPLKQSDLENIIDRWTTKNHKSKSKPIQNISVSEPDLTSVKAIDQKIFANLINLMGEGIKELIGIFINDTEMLIENIYDAINNQDMEKLGMFSHRLKSSSANVGAIGLSKICKTIEEHSRENKLINYMDLLLKLKEEFNYVKINLSEFTH